MSLGDSVRKSGEKLLFCKRMKDPYKGKYNLVGGKIEPSEDGFVAAYRELEEETGITKEQVTDLFRNRRRRFLFFGGRRR